MIDPLKIALISAGSAIVATLITILLTPHVQYRFWTKQRRFELRLALIDDLTTLAAEFIHHASVSDERPSDDFLKSLLRVSAKVKRSFSQKAFAAFKEMEVMIGPKLHGGLGPEGKKGIHDFVDARDLLLEILYGEAGLE
jgi:hypothetical protein